MEISFWTDGTQKNGYPRKKEKEKKARKAKKVVKTDREGRERQHKHLLNHKVQPEYQESSHVSAHITQGPMGTEGETGAPEPSSKK